MTSTPGYQPTNPVTLSGVHPGSRTAVVQQVLLRPLASQEAGTARWARLLWQPESSVCRLFLQETDSPDGRWEEEPLLELVDPLAGDFLARLRQALGQEGWQLRSCGSCAHWRPLPRTTHPDGLPLGRCVWQPPESPSLTQPPAWDQQSGLALSCVHWQEAQATQSPAPEEETPSVQAEPPEALVKGGLLARLGRRLKGEKPRSQPEQPWWRAIQERSGVGAGTEPCFACQGRLANLGAFTQSTPQGDRRTSSVWRCRRCHTFYLNDWVDRWERLDSLETEERILRLAPAEALITLARFLEVAEAIPGAGPDPATWLEELLDSRPLLSHRVVKGR